MTPKRRDWVRKKVVPHKTTLMLRGGAGLANDQELFERVFWKSRLLARRAAEFWKGVSETEPDGMLVKAWKEYCEKFNFSVGQYYNMIHGLVGAGMLEKRDRRWHASTGILRELEQMVKTYSKLGGWTHREP